MISGKIKKILVLLVVIVLGYCEIIFSLTSPYLGIKGANFLKIGLSPRAEGMGASFVSIESGAINSINYNPAGLTGVKNIEFNFSTLDWIDNVSINNLAFAKPVKKIDGVIASSLTFLYLSPITHYNDWGEDVGAMPFYNLAFTAGYARIISKYKTGINLKLLYEKINTDSLVGFAFDIGGLYEFKDFSINLFNKYILLIRDFTVGAVFKNIGTKIGNDYLPSSFEWGYSLKILKDLKFSLTVVKPLYTFGSFIDSDYKMNFGFEYYFKNVVTLRTGYKLNYDIPNSFTFGFGIKTKFNKGWVFIDYAYASYTPLEKTNRIGVTLKVKEWKFWE